MTRRTTDHEPAAPRRRRSRQRGRERRSLGPVADLERHLPPEWWRNLFTAVYLKTDGDVVENDANTSREVDWVIASADLAPNDRLLDVCCGQGRHLIELARRGFTQLTGLDRSRYLVRLARTRASTAGLRIAFHEGDARRHRFPAESFDCATILGNSFGYFDTVDDDDAVLRASLRALRPGGRLLMDVADGSWMRTHFEARSWEWIDQIHFVCRERSLSGDGSRLICREVVTHAERGVIADQFYAERLYSRDELQQLVANAGFGDVELTCDVETASTRGQDVGMMARRYLLRAVAPERRPERRSRTRPQRITVVLGDPTLPDPVKVGGKFNAEDFDTVEKLKASLAELEDFELRFHDEHKSLMAELLRARPEFVLNLCDEGFENDPLKELHVPALLEMLHIPYSGASPACLALCYDKALIRSIARSLDVPVPLETFYDPADRAANLPSIFPALIKPNQGDSSIGITQRAVVNTPEQLLDYVEELRRSLPGRAVLIQEFLSGPEYTVGVIGNPGSRMDVLPILEVDYSRLDPSLPPILGYESKWNPDSPYWTDIDYMRCRAAESLQRRLIDLSLRLFERTGCRDYARFDFRTDAAGEVKLLEVNPNPGWCWDGKLNLMAQLEGISYTDLLQRIIEAAHDRWRSSTDTAR